MLPPDITRVNLDNVIELYDKRLIDRKVKQINNYTPVLTTRVSEKQKPDTLSTRTLCVHTKLNLTHKPLENGTHYLLFTKRHQSVYYACCKYQSATKYTTHSWT